MTMTMDSAAASDTLALDARTLLARINQRIALVRGWLSHDHGDEPYWWARSTTAPRAQCEREALRRVADLVHVERATVRGRIHGSRFPSLDAQRAWLDQQLDRHWPADLLRLPRYANLTLLRAGKLPL
jgi:hypothetical protein